MSRKSKAREKEPVIQIIRVLSHEVSESDKAMMADWVGYDSKTCHFRFYSVNTGIGNRLFLERDLLTQIHNVLRRMFVHERHTYGFDLSAPTFYIPSGGISLGDLLYYMTIAENFGFYPPILTYGNFRPPFDKMRIPAGMPGDVPAELVVDIDDLEAEFPPGSRGAYVATQIIDVEEWLRTTKVNKPSGLFRRLDQVRNPPIPLTSEEEQTFRRHYKNARS